MVFMHKLQFKQLNLVPRVSSSPGGGKKRDPGNEVVNNFVVNNSQGRFSNIALVKIAIILSVKIISLSFITLGSNSCDVFFHSKVQLQPLVLRRRCAPGPDPFGFKFVREVHSCIACATVPSATCQTNEKMFSTLVFFFFEKKNRSNGLIKRKKWFIYQRPVPRMLKKRCQAI